MIDFVTSPISDSAVLVRVGGNLQESNRSYFFDCVGDIVDSGVSHIVVECNKLGLISSSGLAALLLARKKATRKGCKIYLTHLNSVLADLLKITRLGLIFSVYPTTEEALAKFQKA